MPVSKKKVLIVEDEKALSNVMSLKFEGSGFDVLIAKDGELAVEIFKKEKPDIVLVDLMIPVLNGFEVLNKIRKDYKSNVPIFVLSNLGQKEDIEKAKKIGVQEYFVKADTPINDIVKKVELVLK